MKTRIAAIGLCVLVASTSFAGPANKSAIPDTAKWVVHVDVSAVTASGIANGIMGLITGKDSPIPAAKIAKAIEGWKLLGNAHSVTLYGPSSDETQAVVLFTSKFTEEQIKSAAKIDAQSKTTAHGNHVIYTFAGKSRGGEPRDHYGCIFDNTTVVAGASLAQVKAALDVLDGKAKCLGRTNPLSEMLTPSKGSFGIVAAVDVNTMVAAAIKDKPAIQDKPGTQMVAKVQDLRLENGETGGNLYLTANASMLAEEDAKAIETMLNGLIAMGMFKAAKDKDAMTLLQAIKVDRKGRNVGVGMELPVETILDKIGEKMAAAAMQLQVKVQP